MGTAVFVDSGLRSAKQDMDHIIQEQLEQEKSVANDLIRFFAEADDDHTGYLSLEELEAYLKDEKVLIHLHALGIEASEASGLFNLLDMNESGEVDIGEFILGCLRLKGEARSVDVATLMYENRRMIGKVQRFTDTLGEEIGQIQ